MIDELKNKKLEAAQRVQFRQLVFMLSVSALHTFATFFYLWTDNLRLESADLIKLFSVIWFVNIALFFGFKEGITAKFKDPVLVVPMMLWLSLGIIFTSYFLNSFRLSMLMLLFGVLILGAFSVRFRNYFFVTISILIGYALVLYQILSNYSENIDATVEVLEFALFILVSIGMLVTVTRISKLQNNLLEQSDRLGDALEKVHNLSIRDEMTGLYNRRKIMELLRNEVKLARSGDYNFVVCYLDLDKFKSINDTFGHAVGDEVIIRFAQVAQKAIRAVDYAGRIGGEEFLIVLTNTQMDECLKVAERLREHMEAESFEKVTDRKSVTVSIGIAEFNVEETLENLLQRADEALYESKETGRNKITKA